MQTRKKQGIHLQKEFHPLIRKMSNTGIQAKCNLLKTNTLQFLAFQLHLTVFFYKINIRLATKYIIQLETTGIFSYLQKDNNKQ